MLAQSVDESEDLYFFDIEDETSEDTFFDISVDDEADVEEDEVDGLRLMEVPEGSHIAIVLGRRGW